MTQQLRAEHYDMLRRYAGGATPDEIAYALGFKSRVVEAVLGTWCDLNRERARLVVAEQNARSASTVSPPGRSVAAAPLPPQPVAKAAPAVSTLEAVLAAGDAHTSPRVRALAERARTSLTVLADLLAEEERTAAARARVAKLEAELAEAKAALPGSVRAGSAAGLGPGEAARIRSWAAKAGVECPARGRVPESVVGRYRAAHA